SPTPRCPTSSGDAVWHRFSSTKRWRPPATPVCGSSPCVRWWTGSWRNIKSSPTQWIPCPPTSNAGWRILSRPSPISSVAMTIQHRTAESPAPRSGPSAFFVTDGDTFVPQPIARGPWGQTISGNYVGGLLGHVLDRDAGDPGFQPARLTVDLFRPAALAPLRIDTSVIRQGRRLKLVDSVVTQEDTVVARASGLFLRRGEQPTDRIWTSP